MAGFGFETTAGLCITGIARQLVGKRLGRGLLRTMEKSDPLALGWLDHHWRVDRNPGYEQNEGHLYYLYGIERVAAFYDLDAFGAHDWYRDGAEWLVKNQDGDGGWGRPEETSFALLFLTRATAAATTGPEERESKSVVHSGSGAVHIRSTGNFQRTFFVDGFDAQLIKSREALPPDRRGLRVVSVEWWVNDELVATVQGDPTSRYATQRNHGPSLLAGTTWTATASSEASKSTASLAFDSLDATRWLATEGDAGPWVRVELTRPLRASMVTLAHAGSNFGDGDRYAGASEVQISVNGKAVLTTDLDPRDPATMLVPFPSGMRVRSLEIRVLVQVPGKSTQVGFSTIGLR